MKKIAEWWDERSRERNTNFDSPIGQITESRKELDGLSIDIELTPKGAALTNNVWQWAPNVTATNKVVYAPNFTTSTGTTFQSGYVSFPSSLGTVMGATYWDQWDLPDPPLPYKRSVRDYDLDPIQLEDRYGEKQAEVRARRRSK